MGYTIVYIAAVQLEGFSEELGKYMGLNITDKPVSEIGDRSCSHSNHRQLLVHLFGERKAVEGENGIGYWC